MVRPLSPGSALLPARILPACSGALPVRCAGARPPRTTAFSAHASPYASPFARCLLARGASPAPRLTLTPRLDPERLLLRRAFSDLRRTLCLSSLAGEAQTHFPRGRLGMDGPGKKLPGRIQEARRPGGVSCTRMGGLPGGPRRGGAPTSPAEPAALGATSAFPGEEAQTNSRGCTDDGAGSARHSAASVEGTPSPWMGLVLPAVTKNVAVAGTALRTADIIALPTDTLYGIAGDARSPVAVERIYSLKRRDARKPLPICVADVADVSQYVHTEHLPAGLLEALLPGPVTLVLPCRPSSGLALPLLSGLSTVAVRIPDAVFVRAVARDLGGALALTSANESNGPSSLRTEEFQALWGQCACVFDGGALPTGDRAGSTIVEILPGDSSAESAVCTFRVLRPGSAEAATTHRLESFGLIARP